MGQILCILGFGVIEVALVGYSVQIWSEFATKLSQNLVDERASHYCGTLAANRRNLEAAAELLIGEGVLTEMEGNAAANRAESALEGEFGEPCDGVRYELYEQSAGSGKWPNWHYRPNGSTN